MARKPNLLEKVVALALAAASRELPDYAHPRSPHRYTQPQLLAILVLRACLKLTYRQSTELLETAEGLQRVLGLKSVPRHTTLEEFASRVATPELLERLLAAVLVLDGRPVTEIAGDSTGLAPTRASAHYLARSGKKGGHYVKLSLILACSLLLPVSMTLARGPANDLADARSLLWRAAGRCSPKAAYFDSGYDAEWLHRFFLRRHGLPELRAAGAAYRRPHDPHAVPRQVHEPARLLRPPPARPELLQRPQGLHRQQPQGTPPTPPASPKPPSAC